MSARSLIALLLLLLGGCAHTPSPLDGFYNGEPPSPVQRLLGLPRGRLPPEQAAVLLRRFATLEPPFGSVTARAALGDPSWLGRARLGRIRMLSGFIALHRDNTSGFMFSVDLRESTSQEYSGYGISLHTTEAIESEEDLRRFFRGEGSAAMQVDEFTLDYPEGFILSVQPTKREFIEDIGGHDWSPPGRPSHLTRRSSERR